MLKSKNIKLNGILSSDIMVVKSDQETEYGMAVISTRNGEKITNILFIIWNGNLLQAKATLLKKGASISIIGEMHHFNDSAPNGVAIGTPYPTNAIILMNIYSDNGIETLKEY